MARPEVRRGDIWLIDLGPAQKIRLAVILSVTYLDHERALMMAMGSLIARISPKVAAGSLLFLPRTV